MLTYVKAEALGKVVKTWMLIRLSTATQLGPASSH
jgi:hypothetical protein